MSIAKIETGTDAGAYGEYGITTELSGYTIDSENLNETPLVEPVADQQNALRDELEYDRRWELRLTIRGKAAPTATSGGCISNDIITYGGKKYKVDSCEDAGTYHGIRRYNITAHRTSKYPKQS